MADDKPVEAATIREIAESPRLPGRYRVTLSDGRALLLDARALADAGATRVAAELPATAVAQLIDAAGMLALSDRAMGYLARGRRSRREIELRLRRLHDDAPLVARVLDRLAEAGAIADAQVARAEAAARLRRGEAPGSVRRRLRGKGVADSDTAAALAESVEAEAFDEDEACRAAAEKRVRSIRDLPRLAAKRRLIAFLNRRGYRGDVIHRTVHDVLEGWVASVDRDGADDGGDDSSGDGGDDE